MKKLDMQPTQTNILRTMQEDVLDRNKEIKNFIEMLDYIDENLVISINGDWGSGKTFFVKQVISILKYTNKNLLDVEIFRDIEQISTLKDVTTNTKYVPIYYNAWDNDSHPDPILSLMYNIVKGKGKDGVVKISSSMAEKICSVLDVLNPWSSGSISNLLEKCRSSDLLAKINDREHVKKLLNELLDETLQGKGDKIIVFIDELDRCNPRFAVNVLEQVKHLFDNDKVIFVFSTNISQLTHTISNYYGNQFDSYRYLNKFFDVMIDLNYFNKTSYLHYLGYLDEESWFNYSVVDLIENYNLSLRDMNRYKQLIDIVFEYVVSFNRFFEFDSGYEAMLYFILPILLLLKVVDIKKFMNIINGTGYDIFEGIVINSRTIREGLDNRMTKIDDEPLTDEKFKIELQKIYNTIFNNTGNMIYHGEDMIFNSISYNRLMKVVSLLKSGLKY